MGLLLATTINFAPAGALDAGPGLDTAVMFLVMEGSFSVFATILNLAGVALFATSVMNANLMGSNNLLTGLLVIGPAVVGSFLLLLAPLLGDGVFAVFLIGNVMRWSRWSGSSCSGSSDQEERHPGNRFLTEPGRR